MQSDVLVLSPEFGYGGIGNHSLKIANFLLDEGYGVLVHTIKSKRIGQRFFHSNLEVVEIARPVSGFTLFNPFFDVISYLHLKGRKKPHLIVRALPPFYFNFARISKTAIPELAISHGVRESLIGILDRKRKMEVKHKFFLSMPGKLLTECERNLLHKAKRIVAVSEYTSKELQRYYRIEREKILVIHNCVDTSIFKRKKTEKIVSEVGNKVKDFKGNSFLAVFVARPTPGKNFGLLYDVITNIREKANLKFAIVGMDRNDKYVKYYARNLKESNVLFLGYVDNNLLSDVYSLSDFLLITSCDENLPTVLLEAMACGVIPVCTNIGGIPEVVKNYENGFLVRPNAEAFLEVIQCLVNSDLGRLSEISKNAEKRIDDEFSVSVMRKKYVDTVNEMIST